MTDATRNDVSATCCAHECPGGYTIFRGEACVMDLLGGGWRHTNCEPQVLRPDCLACGQPYGGHMRTWVALECYRGLGRYVPGEPHGAIRLGPGAEPRDH